MDSDSAATSAVGGTMLRSSGRRFLYDFLYDSHCHLKPSLNVPPATISGTLDAATGSTKHCDYAQRSVTALVICGTHPLIDWDLVAQASVTRAESLLGFGVHPWFVPHATSSPQVLETNGTARKDSAAHPSADDGCGCSGKCCSEATAKTDVPDAPTLSLSDLLALLERRLQQHPHAIVAEIGLDKLRGPPEAVQVEAFIAQLRLAAAYRRPVSVHCVRHYGLLLQVLRDLSADDTPPAIILHAFTGSLEVAKSLLSLKNKKRISAATSSAISVQSLVSPVDCSAAERKKAKRGGATADTVRIKDLIFFGVGVSTSFTVKNFATQTLPFLLDAQRVLFETDEHYSGIQAQSPSEASELPVERETSRSIPSGCHSSVLVNPQEHVECLAGLMGHIYEAMSQNQEFAQKAEASSLSVEGAVRNALIKAYSEAFRSVLEKASTP